MSVLENKEDAEASELLQAECEQWRARAERAEAALEEAAKLVHLECGPWRPKIADKIRALAARDGETKR